MTSSSREFLQDPFNDDSTYKSQQMLKLTSERFSVPEVLFHPSDISIDQMGLPEAIFHSVNLSPPGGAIFNKSFISDSKIIKKIEHMTPKRTRNDVISDLQLLRSVNHLEIRDRHTLRETPHHL